MFKFLKNLTLRSSLSMFMILAILIIIVVIYKKKIEKFVSPSQASSVAVVTYYYLPKCPHCVAFSEEWATFQGSADPSLMTAVTIDASDPNNSETIAASNISGYPTIRITKNGNEVDYRGPRTASALIDYVSNL
jgi:thiol-disulfide isomerase/thioredoxin